MNTAQDSWVAWSLFLEVDDNGDPVMPLCGAHGYKFHDTNFQELLQRAEDVVTTCKLQLVQYKARNAVLSDEISAASCLQALQGGTEE